MIGGSTISLAVWGKGLLIKLLEITHGQWLYRIFQLHDSITSLHTIRMKEEIQRIIENEIEHGGGNTY